MRLRRLELQGFKSFLDKTVLTFQPGITGVVGPNGCGKSNIVDAIQWVMGEQSAKHLRGDTMTDVIFNGSDTRAATSMAEVSLVLEREGVALAPQFAAFDKGDEIAVTRRVYRDGTGEYFINKVACRLKDVHELFMDTGVGKRAYSIIEQGQIDRMINVKPEDRRFLFEEVAGITKYKAKKREAEKKLETTRQNLLRLADIVTELEKQIRSLKIQATRAKRYKELKTELEAVDLFLLGRNLFQHKNAIDDCSSRRDILVTKRSESDAQYGEMDAEATLLEVQRIDQEKLFQSLTQKERDLALLIQRLESQLGLLDERRKHLSEGQEKNQQEERDLSENIQALSQEILVEEEEKSNVAVQMTVMVDEIRNSESQLKDQQDQKNRAQQRRDSLSRERNQIGQREVSLQSQKQHADERERDLLEHQTELNMRLSEMLILIESHKEALAQVEQKIDDCRARGERAESDVTNIHSECQSMSAELSQLEEKLYQTRENFHTQNSRLESLKELQENLEGYSPTAQEILLRLEGHPTAVPLAEVLTPQSDIEDHVETLLGLDMNTLLVKTTEEAEQLTRLINEKGFERVRILAVDEMHQASLPANTEISATPILSKIQVREGYESIVQSWLGNTYLVENQDSLFGLRKSHPASTFVTLDTKTVGDADRSIVSGTVPTKTGVFARRREIEELRVVAAAIEIELAQLTSGREALLARLQSQEKLHSEMKDQLSSIHIESVEYRKEKEKVQLETNRAERDHQNLNKECERNTSQINGLREQKEKVLAELETLKVDEIRVQEELSGIEVQIETLAQDFEALSLAVNEKKVERSRLDERANSLHYKLQKLTVEVDDLTERREQVRTQQEQSVKELDSIEQNKSEIRTQSETSAIEKNETMVLLSDTQNAFNLTCNRLNELRDKKSALQKQREEMISEIQDLELKLTHEKSNFEHLCGISIERYQREPQPLDDTVVFDLVNAPLFLSQLSVEWVPLPDPEKKTLLEEHLKSVREKVSRYGEVNLTAIQEFDEIQKRYDFLTEQKTDLENSIKILEEAIQKIDETTKIRFAETFEAVNIKFKEIFPILFNGGKAELTLMQAEGQLDTGVDIMVQPPGKRLQSITLLSGGEKALTAVSLILAIFARKPSPFCLLDEVDAPLDDANVSRFNTVIRKMAEKTQFIVVTHNKKTMEIAEALYGVTMERAGVSKMTSVRLN